MNRDDGEAKLPPDLDLAPYSEELRRVLYDKVARIVLAPEMRDPGVVYPDAEDLIVFYAWGRWFAVWKDLDEEAEEEGPVPPSRVWQVVRVSSDPKQPNGIMLHEV